MTTMSSFINNTPNKDYLTKFNEPKNINHLANTDRDDIQFYENLNGYLVGTTFEEEHNQHARNINGNLHCDPETNNYYIVVDEQRRGATQNDAICPASNSVNTAIDNDKYNFSRLTDLEAEDASVEKFKIIDHNKDINAASPDFKINSMTQFYVGSLSVIGLLIFFRMLYRVK